MEKERLDKYYEILEKIIDMTCCPPQEFDRDKFIELLREFAVFFRLSKGVSEFYLNTLKEEEGVGEIMCDYDNGKGGHPVVQIRVVPPSGVVMKGTLYMADDEEPLTDEEYRMVEMVHRHLLAFIARNRLQRTVSQFAFTDEDGYNNRRYMMRHIHHLINDGEQYGQVAACINIKNFGAVNHELGRKNGDIILRKYYEYYLNELGDKGVISRLGGDNFILFFPMEMKDKILESFGGIPIIYDEEKGSRITISSRAGVYFTTKDSELTKPGQIMDRIYPAVQIARNNSIDLVVYDQEMLKRREHLVKIRNQFAEGIAKKEIVAFYQPKVDVNTGEVVGAEALARWFKDGQMVMPAEFIPILEMNMDICTLDFYIFDRVCADIRKWIDEGRNVPRVSVNFSRKHLNDPDLLGHILEIINRHEIRRKYVEIELTETTSDVEFKELTRIVFGLHREGIRTSVDDFGNGFSSLNLIRSIPWDVVKIDRSLLPMDEDRDESITTRMYRHVVSMANDIGMECVTEGVETYKQVELLKENQCHIAQGFYFDKPMPVEEFEKLLSGEPYADKINK